MNKTISIIFTLAIIFLSGCYEVSEDSLFEEYEPNIVVEAQINNLNQPYFVKISQSAKPTDSVNSYPISNARVIVSDDKGNSELLNLVEPGTYEIKEIIGMPKTEYSLSIQIDNKNYTAVAKMENMANIFRTEIKYISKFVPTEGNYIKLYIEKASQNTSYYKLEVTKNDVLYNSYNDLIVFDDAFSIDTIKYLVPYAFKRDDTVLIDLHVISSDMYLYYYELSKQTNNPFRYIQPPMQNPSTNIDNNVLGYFQVSAVTQLNIVIN